MKINLFSPWYSWKIAELALKNNHSLTHLRVNNSITLHATDVVQMTLITLKYRFTKFLSFCLYSSNFWSANSEQLLIGSCYKLSLTCKGSCLYGIRTRSTGHWSTLCFKGGVFYLSLVTKRTPLSDELSHASVFRGSFGVYIQINTWAFPYWPGYHPETPILARDGVEGQYGSRDDNQAKMEMPMY